MVRRRCVGEVVSPASGARYGSRNVLDDPELREGIKKFSNWPTIPQVKCGCSSSDLESVCAGVCGRRVHWRMRYPETDAREWRAVASVEIGMTSNKITASA